MGSDTETREKVYSQFRETILKIVRGGDVSDAVPGFLTNPLHLKNQYEWLCNRCITHKIEGELFKQLGHLEKVLQVWRPFQDYEQKLEAARVKSAQQMSSSLPIIVCWLRELNFHWHKVRGGLFLHPGEEEDASPHFLVVKNAAGMSLPFDVTVPVTYGQYYFKVNLLRCGSKSAFNRLSWIRIRIQWIVSKSMETDPNLQI